MMPKLVAEKLKWDKAKPGNRFTNKSTMVLGGD